MFIFFTIYDTIYCAAQWLDPSFGFAKFLKHQSKHYLRNSEIIKEKTIEYCLKYGYDVGVTGHTHHAMSCPNGIVEYYNTGCFTELPATYLTIINGNVKLEKLE